jgi:hypothetical protein
MRARLKFGNLGSEAVKRRLTFSEAIDAYWIRDRGLMQLIESGDTVTLRFDLYHCDDDERSKDGTEYLLDLSVPRDRFALVDGDADRLRGHFSGDVLSAELAGGTLRMVVDCTFYAPRGSDIAIIELTGGEADFVEHPPAAVS